jgi:uncharacterized protein YqeY
MTLLEQITEDYKQAMKNHEEVKKSALNYLLAQIKNKKIELRADPTDDDVIAVIKKEIKSLNETLLFLEKANKSDEIAIETQKKEILESYLPAMLSREQTEALINETIAKLGISDLKTQRGMLMKELMVEHKSELDGAVVNDIINSKL